ncbi:MAG: Uma2 family endonuclease [Candidatus Bipolaricaulia bacterium]
MAKVEVPTEKLTYEEFLEWCDEDTWAEWVDGEVIVLAPASRKHQELADFLTQVLGIFVKQQELGVVLSAPFQMKTGPELPGREPDLLFVAKERLDLLKETYLEGPADLVVEIISPESRLRDRGEKFAEYELGGVKEYWLLDPEERRADFYILGEDGRYRLTDSEPSGIYHSRVVPDFWLQVDWLWQEPLPSPIRAVAEIADVDPALIQALEQALRGKQS